jgi:hypothetical protein
VSTPVQEPIREHWFRECWCGRASGTSIEELHLPIGLEGALVRAGFHTVAQLRDEPAWSLRLVAKLPRGADQVIGDAIRKFEKQQREEQRQSAIVEAQAEGRHIWTSSPLLDGTGLPDPDRMLCWCGEGPHSLTDIGFSYPIVRALSRRTQLSDPFALETMSDNDLLSLPTFGLKRLEEIRTVLARWPPMGAQ